MPLFRSLRTRVLFWVSVTLTALFAITIIGLDVAFRRTTESSMDELLRLQLLGLIALAEETPDQELTLAAGAVINPQFSVADSGLYGELWDADGVPVWRSGSLVGRDLPVPGWPASGEQSDHVLSPESLPEIRLHLRGITWEFADGSSLPYTFGVAVSLDPYAAQQADFRRNLIGWFAGITLTMLAVLTGLLAFVMRPLRRLEREVREVESGSRSRLTGGQPTELIGLARGLNALIDTERRRLARYRNNLDDLAHSLKTPLAAMRTLLADPRGRASAAAESLDREVERMDQRVSYQLRRARASGATGLGAEPVHAVPLVTDLVDTLDKVYRDKQVRCELDLDDTLAFYGDPGDFSEIAGNVLENAYKYCRQRVQVTGRQVPGGAELCIEDDGPGIEETAVDSVLERGIRADESVPGQGIGLAVVRETVELYDGELEFGRSSLGGARIRILLRRPGYAG
jgi:two-component system sensor histidine kinase PhoQ